MNRAVILSKSSLKIYQSKHKSSIIAKIERHIPEKLQPWWHHEAGPQTVFFWGPLFKWGLVLAALADLGRDPATISRAQTISLMVSGLLWSRYSMVIVPKNYLLFSVNTFVFVSQAFQMYRILTYKVVTNKGNTR